VASKNAGDGFGKQVGANNAHCAAAHLGYEVVLREFARTILGAAAGFSAASPWWKISIIRLR